MRGVANQNVKGESTKGGAISSTSIETPMSSLDVLLGLAPMCTLGSASFEDPPHRGSSSAIYKECGSPDSLEFSASQGCARRPFGHSLWAFTASVVAGSAEGGSTSLPTHQQQLKQNGCLAQDELPGAGHDGTALLRLRRRSASENLRSPALDCMHERLTRDWCFELVCCQIDFGLVKIGSD